MTTSAEQSLTRATLRGNKLYLRPLTADDVAKSYHWHNQADPQALSCLPAPCLTAVEAAEQFKSRGHSSDGESFMVVRKKDNRPVGQAAYFGLNNLNRSAGISVLIDPEEHQNGYGKETLVILCRFLFRQRGLNKVQCRIGAFNSAGVKLLESSGFKRDGALRHHHFYLGELHDELIYSLLLFEFEG